MPNTRLLTLALLTVLPLCITQGEEDKVYPTVIFGTYKGTKLPVFDVKGSIPLRGHTPYDAKRYRDP